MKKNILTVILSVMCSLGAVVIYNACRTGDIGSAFGLRNKSNVSAMDASDWTQWGLIRGSTPINTNEVPFIENPYPKLDDYEWLKYFVYDGGLVACTYPLILYQTLTVNDGSEFYGDAYFYGGLNAYANAYGGGSLSVGSTFDVSGESWFTSIATFNDGINVINGVLEAQNVGVTDMIVRSGGTIEFEPGVRLMVNDASYVSYEGFALREYDDGTKQLEIGSESLHLNLNTDDRVSVDTQNGKKYVAYMNDIPGVSNMMTTDTAQDVTGTKTFKALSTFFEGNVNVDGNVYINGGTKFLAFRGGTENEKTTFFKFDRIELKTYFDRATLLFPSLANGVTETLATLSDIPPPIDTSNFITAEHVFDGIIFRDSLISTNLYVLSITNSYFKVTKINE